MAARFLVIFAAVAVNSHSSGKLMQQFVHEHFARAGEMAQGNYQILTGKHRRGARTAFFCAAEQTGGSKGSFTWKKTVVGSAAMAPCTMSKDQATEFATRFCGHGGVWSPLDDSFCRYLSEKTANLDGLHNTPVKASNVKSVSMMVTNLTSNYDQLGPEDINLAVNIVQDVTRGGHSDNEAFRYLVTTASQLSRVNSATRQEGETTYNSSLKLVAALKDVARLYTIPNVNASVPLIQTDQISMDMVEVKRGVFSGMTFYKSTETSSKGYERQASRAFKHGTKDKTGVQVGIELPESLLDHVTGLESGSTVRVNFITYQTNNFFVDSSLSNGSRVDNNTRVISTFVGNTSVYNLSDPVTIVFTPFQPGYAPQCVFWDNSLNEDLGGWKSDGCTLVEDVGSYVSCECNHLTSFSVVFSLCSGNCPCKSVSDGVLSTISYIGCSISIFGLSATIVCILLAKCYRGHILNSAHITVNFCLALLLSLVFFFSIRAAVSSSGACTTVAAFLHFFMLATFLWMMIEGMCMYCDLVIAMGVDQSSKRFRTIAYTVAWGIPALLVLMLVAVQEISYSISKSSSSSNSTDGSLENASGIDIYGAIEVYRDDETEDADLSYCWINNTGVFLGTFAVPALIIVWLNFFITIRIYFVLRSRSKMAAKTTTKRDKTGGRRRMKAMVMVSLNLGVTWLFGAATLIDYQGFFPDASGPDDAICTLITVFQYLFAISNSLLGFLIFAFNVLFNNRMRYQLMSRFCPGCLEKKDKQTAAKEKEQKTLTLKFIPRLLSRSRQKPCDQSSYEISDEATLESGMEVTVCEDDM